MKFNRRTRSLEEKGRKKRKPRAAPQYDAVNLQKKIGLLLDRFTSSSVVFNEAWRLSGGSPDHRGTIKGSVNPAIQTLHARTSSIWHKLNSGIALNQADLDFLRRIEIQ